MANQTGLSRQWCLGVCALLGLTLVGCQGGWTGAVTSPFQEQQDPWVLAGDAFVIRDCVAVQENLARAELNPDFSEENFARSVFMRGVCSEQQGDIADAVGAYKYVVTKHPNTSSAFLSGERLRQLSSSALVQ